MADPSPAQAAPEQGEETSPQAPPSSTPSPTPGTASTTSINLLILITGSIAAVKTGLLLDQFAQERCHIRLASTSSALHFLHRAQPSKTGIPFKSILTDDQEWSEWQAMNDAVVHIELRRWADLVVIAPLDANSLAKIANGLCDNLVTCVMRAWQVKEKPVIICPAMNTAMWIHPITAQQVTTLSSWYTSAPSFISDHHNGGNVAPEVTDHVPTEEPTEVSENAASESQKDEAKEATEATATPVVADPASEPPVLPETLEAAMFQVVGPVAKRLACGDFGLGGMASVEEIARHVRHTMALLRVRKAEREAQKATVE